jgi:hypothetical protein
MAIITLTEDEETITIIEDSEITNCYSIQNQSLYSLRWSSIPFSATNRGALFQSMEERIFTGTKTIYLRIINGISDPVIHVRSVGL